VERLSDIFLERRQEFCSIGAVSKNGKIKLLIKLPTKCFE
jgi:hypothetical protein